MAAAADPRQTAAERLIAGAIGATWLLWLVGGLYIAGPLLGWTLAFMVARSYYLSPILPPGERPAPPSLAIWAWLIGMAAMLPILLIGHINFGLGAAQTLKSAVGWAKGWALLALFPLAGFALPIRLEVLARAICRLGRQTLFLLPLFLVAPLLHLPQHLWVSPLHVLGGSGDEYFTVTLYTIEPGAGTARWQFFAPWSPAAGMVAVIHFLIAREERHAGWRWTGYAAALSVALLSQSRLALVALAITIPLVIAAGRIKRPATWFAAVPAVLVAGWFAPQIGALIERLTSDFAGARADSSRVRAALGRIAVERWQNEAYWFGHGIVERGPHLVEYMPIGSHHSWYGLLFVKGLLGVIALAVPMVWMLIACLIAATRSAIGRLGLAMALTYWLYSFGENLEVLTYIGWPALLVVGMALKPAAFAQRNDRP
ncbi:MAG: O-antigen ligase domain-containing protein [Sphingopyxis sp.]|uniref:O-antigen ligase domain-containing protein n=1 Tax=Sphingopyxis sp. TaxID=1908224 RepID=UPI002AB99F2F|nr:O-antigen ligase domain-containing protein [Sphingopyxis sp.]MDZ3830814.1 O-antigen ligase domain-containing protein [Sphingopyxis sp.]